VEERRLRIGSLFEWLVAGAGVFLLIWVISVPIQRLIGPRVEASLVEAPSGLPPGIPAGATNVPVMLLLDGREIRHGLLQTRLNTLLPEKFADGPAHMSSGEFGERRTRAYVVDGTRVYIVSERLEPNGPMRVAGIYLP
jgi:hypothetical protein